MVDVRGFNGGMNTDSAPELLPSGDYTYAMNITNGSEGITNLPGNNLLQGAPPPTNGSEWVCGAHFDKTRQRIIYFTFNATQNHRIIVVDVITEVHTVLFEDRADTGGSTIFNWGTDSQYNPNKIIKDIKIVYRDGVGDLVYFVDPLKRPLKFNISTLPTLAATNDVIFDYFKVIKAPPTSQPICNYFDATGRSINNLRKKLFQFKYRFVFDDDEKSVWSAISKVPLPTKSNDEAYYADGTKSNAINVSIQTGAKNIKKIEIAGRVNIESVWSDFFLIETVNKSQLSLSNNSTYQYSFFNDGSYIPIDIEEGNLLFDYVPDEANALELANGNTLVYGGIKEGLPRLGNFDVTTSIVETTPAIPGSVTFIETSFNNELFDPTAPPYTYYNTQQVIELTGTVNQGDKISFSFSIYRSNPLDINNLTPLFEPPINYTVTSGQTLYDAIVSIRNLINSTSSLIEAYIDFFSGNLVILRIQTLNSGEDYFISGTFTGGGLTFNFEAFTGATGNSTDSISTLKWKGRYKYGLIYYSKDGKTNGVYIGNNKNLTVDIPEYKEILGQPKVFTVQMNINHAPPSWASYYHVVRTRELTSSFSKFFITKATILSETSNTPAPYIYLNIQNLSLHGQEVPASATIINYSATSFVKGDRVRIIKNMTSSSVAVGQKDYEILGVLAKGGTDIHLKLPFVAGMNISFNINDKYLIEILRPAPVISDETENVYYEIGERFDVVNDINGNPIHNGSFQNQIIGAGVQPAIIRLTDGDYYTRLRKLVTDSFGGSAQYTEYTCMDSNFSDFWESGVWSQGRSVVIDETARPQYFPALLRFSNSYLQGSNINNLNRFYPENQEEADNSFGDILRLKTRENFIRMFQRYKVGMIPIYRSIIVDNAQSSQVALSEKLLNKPNYYSGEYGIDKYGSSLVSTDYGDYFTDTLNRAIIRVSLDGVTNISDTFNLADWANSNINIDTYGYGCFNYENRNVIMLIGSVDPDTNVITNNIVAYSESDKKFESFYGFTKAQAMLFINGLIYTLYVDPTFQVNQGWHLYRHDSLTRNNFYGQQQSSTVSTVFNGNFQLKKTYTAIEELANGLWTVNLSTGPLTNQITNLVAADFQKPVGNTTFDSKENKFNATIKRDTTSPGGKYLGTQMKGLYAQVQLNNAFTTPQRLISVSLKYIQSPLTNM
jgi:hypothetical protein